MKSEINIYVLFGILFIHWIADFIFQTDKQAKGKSKNWSDLLAHTITYSLTWVIVGFISIIVFMCIREPNYIHYQYIHDRMVTVFYFSMITLVAHTITDYFTSRLNSKLYSEGKIHYFFVSVGFDQILHYLQLIITFQLLR